MSLQCLQKRHFEKKKIEKRKQKSFEYLFVCYHVNPPLIGESRCKKNPKEILLKTAFSKQGQINRIAIQLPILDCERAGIPNQADEEGNVSPFISRDSPSRTAPFSWRNRKEPQTLVQRWHFYYTNWTSSLLGPQKVRLNSAAIIQRCIIIYKHQIKFGYFCSLHENVFTILQPKRRKMLQEWSPLNHLQ